jgi:hypothetical protein
MLTILALLAATVLPLQPVDCINQPCIASANAVDRMIGMEDPRANEIGRHDPENWHPFEFHAPAGYATRILWIKNNFACIFNGRDYHARGWGMFAIHNPDVQFWPGHPIAGDVLDYEQVTVTWSAPATIRSEVFPQGEGLLYSNRLMLKHAAFNLFGNDPLQCESTLLIKFQFVRP